MKSEWGENTFVTVEAIIARAKIFHSFSFLYYLGFIANATDQFFFVARLILSLSTFHFAYVFLMHELSNSAYLRNLTAFRIRLPRLRPNGSNVIQDEALLALASDELDSMLSSAAANCLANDCRLTLRTLIWFRLVSMQECCQWWTVTLASSRSTKYFSLLIDQSAVTDAVAVATVELIRSIASIVSVDQWRPSSIQFHFGRVTDSVDAVPNNCNSVHPTTSLPSNNFDFSAINSLLLDCFECFANCNLSPPFKISFQFCFFSVLFLFNLRSQKTHSKKHNTIYSLLQNVWRKKKNWRKKSEKSFYFFFFFSTSKHVNSTRSQKVLTRPSTFAHSLRSFSAFVVGCAFASFRSLHSVDV